MAVKPVLESFDLTFANLEFPVHPEREVGPPANSVKFNGSVEHVKAIADSGIDVCVTSNNHSFDQGLEGIDTTLEVIRQNGLIASGTVPYAAGASQSQLRQPTMLEAKGLRIALYAYTYDLNSYVKEDGKVGWPPRDVPVTILNFKDWTEEYGHYGQEVLCKDVATAANAGSEVTIAFVHWGKEWQLYPTEDMRMAARDMIDCGFGLVVGSHSHVLGGSELYKNKLIVYSLGSLLSAFKPFETRVAAILGVDLQRVGGKAEIVDFWLHPTLIDPKSRIVEIVNADSSGEKLKAWELAKAVFGTSVKSWKINNSTGR
jgi:poly-gamma-glutamate synthesis protein (capsule biosynthesis protein)